LAYILLPICTLAYHLSDDLCTVCLDQTLVDARKQNYVIFYFYSSLIWKNKDDC
jgi:hypothetical protein